ncbi:MAG: hypothetical protein ACRD3B_08105, partial [Candidatus Sulfotelmatobacter sp.]
SEPTEPHPEVHQFILIQGEVMSLRNRFVLPLALSALAVLAACGGSNSATVTPPPGGGFSNTNLNGTYVFSTSGSDVNGAFIVIAGTFTASSGSITGGALDANDPLNGILTAEPITGGNYHVGVDGRPSSNLGLLTLQTAAGNFTFDYVLTSSSHGLITLFDGANGTGSGTMDLQSSVAQSDINGKSYTFSLNGIGSLNSSTGVQTIFGATGTFALDSNGGIGATTAGVEDVNNNGLAICGANGCAITSGSVTLGATLPGLAVFTTNAGTFTFDVYPVDSTHLKLIEIDAAPIIAGDAYTASTAIPSGNNVFTVAGFDSVVQGPFTAAGILNTDGAGNVTTSSVEDINDVGTAIEVGNISGTYSAISGGRSVITLNAFINGNGGLGCNGCMFAAYPSAGGTQLLEIDNAGVTTGVAYAQTATTLADNEGYGMNLSGNNGIEEDDIAEFTSSGGTFTGVIDFNDTGSLTFGQKFTSTYAADSTVSGRGVVTPGSNAFNLVTYVVDDSRTVFVETDSNQVGLGAFVLQNASASSNSAQRHLTALNVTMKPVVKSSAKTKLKRRQF